MRRALAAVGLTALAGAQSPQEVDRMVGTFVRDNYTDLRRCYDLALDGNRKKAGSIGLVLSIQRTGMVSDVRLDRDGVGSQEMVSCLKDVFKMAMFPGFRESADVAVPLAFTAPPVVYGRTVREVEAVVHQGGKLTLRSLHNPDTGTKSIDLGYTVMQSGAAPVALFAAGEALIVYVAGGKGCIKQGRKRNWQAGDAAYVPPGHKYEVSQRGDAPLELLTLAVPVPIDNSRKYALVRGKRKRLRKISGGRVRMLVERPEAYLGTIEAAPGSEIPRHSHQGSAELVFVLSGTGTTRIGDEIVDVVPGTALHIPSNTPHSMRVGREGKMRVVQFYTPAGPEQRFKK